MSCPDKKAKQVGIACGGSGVPQAGGATLRLGGLNWRPISGQPQTGEMYVFPELTALDGSQFFGVLSFLKYQKGRWLYQAYSADQVLAHDTKRIDWFERADRCEPDWSGEAVAGSRKHLQAMRTMLAQNYHYPLAQVGDDFWRKNYHTGAFAIARPGLKSGEYVACAFRPDGRRILGLAAAADSPVKATHLLCVQAARWLAARRYKLQFDPIPGETIASPFAGGDDRLSIYRALDAGEDVPIDALLRYPDLLARFGA